MKCYLAPVLFCTSLGPRYLNQETRTICTKSSPPQKNREASHCFFGRHPQFQTVQTRNQLYISFEGSLIRLSLSGFSIGWHRGPENFSVRTSEGLVRQTHGIARYCMLLHGITWYSKAFHGIVWYCVLQELYGIAWYCLSPS